MDVGNDPFPREEVTGLAAFENLEPGSTVSVIPEELETPPPSRLPPPTPAAARARSLTPPPAPPMQSEESEPEEILEYDEEPASATAVPSGEERRAQRADSTMPLDLSAESPSPDHEFDASGPGWDDPEEAATRVANVDPDSDVTPAPKNKAAAPGYDLAARPATALDMDWDEEEPPTRMRGAGLLDMSPLGPPDGDEGREPSALYDSRTTSAFLPANATMTGGRPSPFPPAPQPLAARSEALGAPSPFTRPLPEREERAGWVDRLKAGDRPTWAWAGAGALGLIVLALIARSFIVSPTPGTVTVTTTPSDASVLVDGHPMTGSSSPYSLSEVAAGQHELIVRKAGFVDYRAMFNLGRGETKMLPPVELVANVQEVGFSIRSAPPGAEVWVDGHATDQLTPARVTGVTPGIHRLQLKRSGFADYELQMFVPESTLLQLPTAELVAGSSASAPVSVSAEPAAPARETREAKVAAHDRAKDDGDDADSSAAAAERRAARASRRNNSSSAPAAPRAPAAAAPRAPSYAQRAAPALAPAQPTAAPMQAAPGSGKMGTLRVNSRPWAQVIVDGRVVGNTPQPGLQLSAGNHKVQLVNPQMGLTKTFSVSIKPGQMVTKVMNLAE